MKIRNGFVSNSSSSSFVVISKNPETTMKGIPDDCLRIGEMWGDRIRFKMIFPNLRGCIHFGWDFKRYYNFLDKCNYTVAQFMGLDKKLRYKYQTMFENVLRKHVDPEVFFVVRYDYNYFHWDSIEEEDCYVDHQSAYYEYKETAHTIFQSEEILENFLFNTKSFIQGGNDNEDETKEYLEAEKMEGSEYRNYEEE